MPMLNKGGLKVVFKNLHSDPEDEIEAVTVVVRVKEVELAISRAREIVRLDKQAWTVTRVVECEIGSPGITQ